MKMLVVMFVLTSYVLYTPSTVEAYHLQTPTEKNLSDSYSILVMNFIGINKINKVSHIERNNATDDAQKTVGQVVGGVTGGSSGGSGGGSSGGSGGSPGSSDESASGSSNSTGSSGTGGGYSNDKEPPKAITNGPYSANEGDEILFDAKASTDSSGISIYEWDFGDGTAKAEGGAVKHRFYNDGIYTITLRVVDGAGNESVTTTSAKIKNVPPSIKELNSNNQETCLTLNGSFSDPGILDTHSATIDWGDGTTALGKVTEKDGSGIIQGTHVYLKNGKYNAEVKLYDNDSFDSRKLSVLTTKEFEYAITFEKNELVIQRGDAGINTVSIKMPSCSSEAATFHVSGLPQGISAEFLSRNNNNASSSRALVVSTTSSSALGESTITVTADVRGIVKTESFMLKIAEPSNTAQNNTDLPSPSLRPPSLQLLISSDKNSGNAPLDVAFQAIAAGGEPPYTWTVDFGDDTNQTLASQGSKVEPSHKYTKQGNYEVLFEVKDSSGIMSKNESLKIVVESLLGKIRIFTTSIIEEVKFDAKTGSITMLASGPEGSNGSASLTVPKAILNLPFTVNINGVKTDFDLADESDDYVLSFSYSHSTKLIRVTGLPVGSLQASDSVEDMIDVIHITTPLTIGSGNNNNNNTKTSSQEISPSLVMMMVIGTGGGAAAGAIYYTTVVRRKHQARMDIEHSTMHGTEQKVTIDIIPKAITLSPGETVTFYARAYDRANNEVYNINFSWSTTVKDAILIPDGRSARFTAPGQTESKDTKLFGIRKGEVIASYGNSAASANVEVHEY